jgi:uncharacterized protein YdaU (DUF1376 family)
MAALPYMQFYVADYLADTAHLSTLQHGAYMILLMNYWQRGKALPAKDEYLAQICRLSLDQWLEIKPVIAEFFTERKGCWTQKRIEEDLQRVTSKSTKLSKAGKASAVKRMSNKCSANVEQTMIYTEAQAHTEAHTDDREKEKDTPPSPAPSDQLTPEWQLYAKACACFKSSPDDFLTDSHKRLLRLIRTDHRVGADKFIRACENRARAPDVPGKIAVEFFLDDFKWQSKIIEWSKGVPKYGQFSDHKKTGGIRSIDVGDGAPIPVKSASG